MLNGRMDLCDLDLYVIYVMFHIWAYLLIS